MIFEVEYSIWTNIVGTRKCFFCECEKIDENTVGKCIRIDARVAAKSEWLQN